MGNMLGLYFVGQIFLAIVLVWAVAAAVYMGIFHAHRNSVALGFKTLAGFVSISISLVLCYLAYSWTYLSW